MNRTFAIVGFVNLDCRIAFGSVTVEATDGVTEASVTLTQRDPESDVAARTTVDLRGRTLLVHAPKPRGPKPHGLKFDIPGLIGRWADRDGLDVEITVPSGSQLKIVNYAGDVVLHGRSGNAEVTGGATSVNLDFIDGDLRLRYGTGPARVGRVSGEAVLKSGSGDATFGEVGGRLAMTCGTGKLDVGVAHDRVYVRNGSGRANVGAAFGDVSLVSGSGGLSIGVPAGRSARLDIVTGGGQVESELPIGDARPDGPAITIQARTGNGNVHLFRAKPPAVSAAESATAESRAEEDSGAAETPGAGEDAAESA